MHPLREKINLDTKAASSIAVSLACICNNTMFISQKWAPSVPPIRCFDCETHAFYCPSKVSLIGAPYGLTCIQMLFDWHQKVYLYSALLSQVKAAPT